MMSVAKIAAIGAAAVFAALFVGWWQVDGPGADPVPGKRPVPLTTMDFRLTNQDGRDVGPETLIGEPSLVFFGFTYCPDVCPTTLSDISGWLDELGPDAEDLNTVFITVDPDRDTVETMVEYVSYFHPQIQGWTGSPDQIAAFAEKADVPALKGWRRTMFGDDALALLRGEIGLRLDGDDVVAERF